MVSDFDAAEEEVELVEAFFKASFLCLFILEFNLEYLFTCNVESVFALLIETLESLGSKLE